MFEHKELDGTINRLIPANEGFVSAEVLEHRGGPGKEPEKHSRTQYGVIAERLVERSLPPESVGDYWSYDAPALPWWGAVINPPHAGLLAAFNSHYGGHYRAPFDKAHNVVAFASAGEEVLFTEGRYTVVRQSDNTELSGATLVELRKHYYA